MKHPVQLKRRFFTILYVKVICLGFSSISVYLEIKQIINHFLQSTSPIGLIKAVTSDEFQNCVFHIFSRSRGYANI